MDHFLLFAFQPNSFEKFTNSGYDGCYIFQRKDFDSDWNGYDNSKSKDSVIGHLRFSKLKSTA